MIDRDMSLFLPMNTHTWSFVCGCIHIMTDIYNIAVVVEMWNTCVVINLIIILFSFKDEDTDDASRVDNPHCVFWDIKANDGIGDWSDKGCQYNRTRPDGHVVCRCNHLTSFAVLVVRKNKHYEFK